MIVLSYHVQNTQNVMTAENTNSILMSENHILVKIKKHFQTCYQHLFLMNSDDMVKLLLSVR